MKLILFIACGGALGSVCRYLVGKCFTCQFPIGTLLVNLIGCFLIGLFYALFERYCNLSSDLKAFLTVGFCGGFTTFSTFMFDCNRLIGIGEYIQMAAYFCASIFFGLILAYIGYKLL